MRWWRLLYLWIREKSNVMAVTLPQIHNANVSHLSKPHILQHLNTTHNSGNLWRKDWHMVADVVNSWHVHNKKTRRTDVQCNNRIDTLKKKYKVEKEVVCEPNDSVTSTWMLFEKLDFFIRSRMLKMRLWRLFCLLG